MSARPVVLRPLVAKALRAYLADYVMQGGHEELARVIDDPEQIRYFCRLGEDLETVIGVEVLVDPAGGRWRHLKTVPAAWLVLDGDVQAVTDSVIPDDLSELGGSG